MSSAGLSSPVSSTLRLRLRKRLGLAAMALVVVRAALAIVSPTLPSDAYEGEGNRCHELAAVTKPRLSAGIHGFRESM